MHVAHIFVFQATFYPIEAEKKGATPSQFGAVFGIIHVSLFTFGKNLNTVPFLKLKAIFWTQNYASYEILTQDVRKYINLIWFIFVL